MKRYLVVALSLLLAGSAADGAKPKPKARPKAAAARPSNQAAPGATASERQLQAELDELVRSAALRPGKLGVYAMVLPEGRVLYSYDADRQLNPASNVKLVATATALDALGPEFTYDTSIYGAPADTAGTVRGDLWLIGMGDPTLRAEHLAELADALDAAGVRRVTGDLVVSADDERDVLVRPSFSVEVVAGAAEGELPVVSIEPDSAYVVVENAARVDRRGKVGRDCKKKKRKKKVCGPLRPTSLDVVVEAAPGQPGVTVRVRGTIRPGTSYRVRRDAPHPAAFTAHTLRAHARRAGVIFEGGVRIEAGTAPPATAQILAVHHSVPLSQLVAMINKPSSNFLADRLIRAVGALRFGGATFENGVRAMTDFLARAGIAAGPWLLENGSGLSYNNHMSAREIATLLAAAWRDFPWARPFVESLAVAGKDGTLKYRFKGRECVGHVYGKTGTLTGVAALSGYVTIGADQVVVFAIMSNGFNNKRRQGVRAAQARLVDAMFHHLKRVALVDEQFPLPAWEPQPESEPLPEDGPLPEDEPLPEGVTEEDEAEVEGEPAEGALPDDEAPGHEVTEP